MPTGVGLLSHWGRIPWRSRDCDVQALACLLRWLAPLWDPLGRGLDSAKSRSNLSRELPVSFLDFWLSSLPIHKVRSTLAWRNAGGRRGLGAAIWLRLRVPPHRGPLRPASILSALRLPSETRASPAWWFRAWTPQVSTGCSSSGNCPQGGSRPLPLPQASLSMTQHLC